MLWGGVERVSASSIRTLARRNHLDYTWSITYLGLYEIQKGSLLNKRILLRYPNIGGTREPKGVDHPIVNLSSDESSPKELSRRSHENLQSAKDAAVSNRIVTLSPQVFSPGDLTQRYPYGLVP